MQLPDTDDNQRDLLAKVAANVGATVTANDAELALLVAILTAFTE